MIPLSTVNNKGFRHMFKAFEPRYIQPDRKILTQHYLPEMYEREKERIVESMKDLCYFSLTTDGWTSRATEGYIAHTVHYINNSWDLCSHLLDIVELPKEHTAVNLASELEECLDRWNLPVTKLAAVTSDNASNIVLAINSLQWQHFR